MYVIVETGGKQYRLSKNDVFEAELLDTVPGKTIKLEKVLLSSDTKGAVEVGKPYLKNAKVDCEVLGLTKSRKTFSFKYKRRKGSRKKKGHRQQYMKLKVKDIKIG